MSNTVTNNRHSSNFVGGVGTYGRFKKANVDMSLFNPFGTGFQGTMQVMGKTKSTHSLKGTYFEDTRSNVVMKATGDASASAGAATTLTAETASRYTFDSSAPYTASNPQTVMQGQLGDQLMFKNGVIGTIISVPTSAGAYSVAPNDPTELIPQVVAADEIINMGQRTQEGSGSPEPYASRPMEFEWAMNFKKKTFIVTDVGATESVYLKQKDGSYVWSFRDFAKATESLTVEHSAELFAGRAITNPLVTAVLKEAPSGDGYIPYVKANGRNIGFASAIQKSHLDQWAIGNAAISAPKSSCFFGGMKQILSIEEELKGLSGDTAYAIFSNDRTRGKAMSLNLKFSDFHLGNYDCYVKHINEFDHEGMLGAKDFPFADTVISVPQSQVGSKESYLTVMDFEKEGSSGSKMGYEEKIMLGTGGENDLEESIDKFILTIRKGLKVNGQRLHSRFYKQ